MKKGRFLIIGKCWYPAYNVDMWITNPRKSDMQVLAWIRTLRNKEWEGKVIYCECVSELDKPDLWMQHHLTHIHPKLKTFLQLLLAIWPKDTINPMACLGLMRGVLLYHTPVTINLTQVVTWNYEVNISEELITIWRKKKVMNGHLVEITRPKDFFLCLESLVKWDGF